jgi:hypothetical protein
LIEKVGEEEKETFGGGSERQYMGGFERKTISSVFRVPRQCPLVLLVELNHIIRINLKFNFCGVRGVAFERNLFRH